VDALHTFLACLCGARIHIPVAIPAGRSVSQIPWPKHGQSQNFACLLCRNVYVYSRTDIHRDSRPILEIHDLYTDWAVWKLSLPCGKDKCSGLIEVRAVMRKDSTIEQGFDLAARLYGHGLTCTKGIHTQTGPSISASAVGFAIDQDWAVLA
jgi:hypothetical protein